MSLAVQLPFTSSNPVYVSLGKANEGRHTPGKIMDRVPRLDMTTRGRAQDVDRGIGLLCEGNQSFARRSRGCVINFTKNKDKATLKRKLCCAASSFRRLLLLVFRGFQPLSSSHFLSNVTTDSGFTLSVRAPPPARPD